MAAIARLIVSVGIRPSGRFASIIPMAKLRLLIKVYFMIAPMMNKIIPPENAILLMIMTKRLISFLNGVSSVFSYAANYAI